MSGKLLTKVKHIEGDGLVGTTEDGENIKVGVPTSSFLIVRVDSEEGGYGDNKKWRMYLNKIENEGKQHCINQCTNRICLQFFDRRFTDSNGPNSNRFYIPYNSYQERE